MFLRSYFGVVTALLLIALGTYLLVSGHYAAVNPWIDGVLIALVGFVFVRIWLK
jgi:predicted Co/Zn/Cd cation transporter (cation efflux family)